MKEEAGTKITRVISWIIIIMFTAFISFMAGIIFDIWAKGYQIDCLSKCATIQDEKRQRQCYEICDEEEKP